MDKTLFGMEESIRCMRLESTVLGRRERTIKTTHGGLLDVLTSYLNL